MTQTSSQGSGPLALWHRHPLRVHIATVFTTVIFAACGTIAWSNHVQGKRIVLGAAVDLIDRIEVEAGTALDSLFEPVETVVTWASVAPLTSAGSLRERMSSLPTLAEVLKRRPQVAAVYVGYANGDFFLVRALRDDASRKEFGAPRHAALLVQSLERRRGAIEPRFMIFDSALQRISGSTPREYRFEPRGRPWYVEAMKARDAVVTAPYVFFTTRQVGLTIARRAGNGRAVVGADVSLSRISETLSRIRPTPSSQLAVFDPAGNRVIAFSDPARLAAGAAGEKAVLAGIGEVSPVLEAVAADAPRFAETTRFESGGREWLAKVSRASPGAGGLASFAIATPLDELLRAENAALRRTIALAALVILACVPLTWWISRRIAENLRDLTHQAAAIRRFDFSAAPAPRTRISEIFDLGRTMGDMRGTIRKFLDITTALASERNYERLMQRVLKEAHDAAGGKGGVVYLLDDEGRALKPAAQAWGDGQSAGPLADLPVEHAGNPVVGATRQTAAALHLLGAKRPDGMGFIDAHFGAAPVRLLTVPLLNRAGEAVGVLCVFLEGGAEEPSLERLALVQAFAGAGAAAIDNQRLLIIQKALLESLISLIATAIDSKSPYTWGHCQRVPELTKMLARAACDVKTGPFAQFDIDENGWEALHIAGWLHDCGKVTTPEYVVDKATKLETIYDRIHEIRMRFEVLKRDAEIACLKAVAAGGDATKLRAALEGELRTLDEEFAFVATCNEGGEFMAPEKIARLKAIAARTWRRTLDNRLGVSRDEGKRMARGPSTPLPATESLLADKPEHIMERGARDRMPEDNPWGFKVKMPEHLYNRGEIYNLCIARGTLTEEERYKINDHMAQTIIMLNKLPFPKHLKSVPELAGGHHEKMDGTGYPKRLFAGDMSVPARIMAIADIFEALTAADRPYKKAKTLSESIQIMARMKKDKHVDPDLFDLFLESGVYRTYAERYMEPQYIDAVDISAHIGARE
ncbi:MAG TPA: HD domain-containing phosphohydrolase [Burkholderiales bacterium]|nr:HD domain-containing phosphohydrolase [Burkholderiales bacterium]